MFGWYPIHDPQRNLSSTVSRMRRNSSRIAPVSVTHQTNSTKRHQRSLSDILSNTHTGVPSRWSLFAWKSPRPETSPDRSSGIEVSASKNSHSDMLILSMILLSSLEKHGCRTQKTDRTVSNWIGRTPNIENWHVYGWKNNKMSLEPVEKPTLGLSITV